MINLILGSACLTLAVWVTAHATLYYVKSDETTAWRKLLATSRDSATWLWGKVLLVAGTLLTGISGLADFFNMPDVSNFIHDKVPVNYLGLVLVLIAAMTFASRARTLLSGT